MKSPYLTSPTSYKPSKNGETPYLAAQQEWDNRIGSVVSQARNWRYAFFSVAALLFGTIAALIILANQQQVIPVVVALDKDSGEPTVVGPVDQKKYQPGPLEIKYFLSQFVRHVRSIPLDQVLIKQNWLRAYSFLRKDAAGLLNEMTQKDPNSPLKKIGKVLVTTQPISVLQIPDTDSYQMRWKETVYSSQGSKLEEYTMLATFIVELDPPKDSNTLQENPLGLFIKNFQWNREI
jgi:type IV secretion system protein VirB5